MWRSNWFLILYLSWSLCIASTHELQTHPPQLLLQLRKHLEYPSQLDIWGSYNGDICNLSSTLHMSVVCEDNFIIELKIKGDKVVTVSEFNGFAIPNQTLSESFSIDSFVTTLTRLTSLRVVSLVSLGIWGPLPDKIHRLYSLEVLDLSSNFMFGSVPPQLSRMVKLNSITLDGNYFNGSLPDWLDSLSNLTVLSLRNNRFKSQLPSSICRITTLTDIALSHNQLTGKLPDLRTLTSLQMLDLRENKLDSDLHAMPEGLITILLSNNSFSGNIPSQFGHLSKLQHLDLSLNHLSGTPPSSLFSLPNIRYLNLASNILSGSIPNSLSCGSNLGFVDISSNKLVGGLPSCLDGMSNKRAVKFGGNCLSVGSQNQLQESYCETANIESKRSRGRMVGILVAVVTGTVLVLVLLALGVLLLCRRNRSGRKFEQNIFSKVVQDNSTTGVSSEVLANARFIAQAAKLGTQGAPACRVFALEELMEATNNFDSSTFMGEGSNGKMYRGRLENGTYVAIRSLTSLKKHSIQNLKLRLDLLSKLHHPHLVGLVGYCIDNSGQDDSVGIKVFLIYEYVSNGNYHAYLSETCPEKFLKWSDRLVIVIGVAKAVHFLHTGVIPGTFNNRLKTNNILLDEHRIGKLSDYGLAVITDEIEKIEVKGEAPKSRTNLEDDVYNFGFILLESLVGPIVTGKGEAFLLNEMASFGSQDGRRRIVDPIVLTTCSQESLSIVVSITSKCLSPEPSTRPSFEDVLWNLQYASQVQAAADSDQKSDSTS
ncbi:hypothetical protein P3X46_034170 [Hevea brasiliensis]|uniref:Protein kinase domain-containing protein n=1 Tax=Hevea brasiliensis TaxID=3981 RepID=A0ABQ9KA64_HEVBR|nr:probable inactive leucine-rich repeat receptor-like protein kinase At3g03770 [Hevea brasiliensis]KAJ9129061.1 hypothetical protein P3X46_034170 [Hevea brasiliensis]